MKRFNDILLQVWPIVSQNNDLTQILIGIGSIVSPHFPIQEIFIRHLFHENKTLETLASNSANNQNFHISACNADCYDELKTIHNKQSTIDLDSLQLKTAEILCPKRSNHSCLVVPLKTATKDLYFFLIILQEFTNTKNFYFKLIGILREPMSVAVRKNLSYHEIIRLKEATEADKRKLLTKLGREKVSEEIIGTHTGLQSVTERVNMVAKSDLPVLIFGETGTGKELVARSIHNQSGRSKGPFIRVNCGAIPPELIDSQLFGHEKGAFTGAVETRIGWFERANDGTLFLDEIGDLPLEAQVRFLRILQDGWMERVGGKYPIRVNVRIVLATNRDLVTLVARGNFREDLWYRISTFPIFLPPLRERKMDMKLLAAHFIKQSATRFGLSEVLLTDQDIQLLTDYRWPGNIRELKAVIDRAVLLGNGNSLEISRALGWQNTFGEKTSAIQPIDKTLRPLDEAIKTHIEQALKRTKGKVEGQSGAARLLKINPQTLRSKMRKLGINWNQFKEN